MYSQGETFYHNIDDDEFELTVLENLIIREHEYLITEDFDGNNYVFLYDEDEEELRLLEDPTEIRAVLDFWKDEYLGSDDIGDWEDDEYYDREKNYDRDEYYGSHDYYDSDYNDDGDYY